MALTAQIDTLIDWLDGYEIVTAQIVEILRVEVENQKTLAAAAGEDPDLWDLKILEERHKPLDDWQNPTAGQFYPPIVNVWFDQGSEKEKGSSLANPKGSGTFNIDCYGLGIARSTALGHRAADEQAAKEAKRAARLVRNILMAEHYTYLGSPRPTGQWCFGRRAGSMQPFQSDATERTAGDAIAVRIPLHVDYLLQVPLVQGQAIDAFSITLRRPGDRVLAYADYAITQLLTESGAALTTESGELLEAEA